jgi:DNA modification methylase
MQKNLEHLRIEYLPIERLKPNPRNPRKHARRQIRALRSSLKKYGFVTPVLIDANDSTIAGHGRVEAAKLEGFTTVPTVRLDHLTPSELREFIIADNRLAELAGWDRELLAAELSGLLELKIDFEPIGFEPGEIDALLSDFGESSPGPDDVVARAQGPCVSRGGDVWMLGRHRISCGDARDEKDYVRLMGSDRAAMLCADPPYNVRVSGHVQGRGRVKHAEFAFASGEMSDSQFRAFLETWLRLAMRFLSNGALAYVFMDWRHIVDLITIGRIVFGSMVNLCVWAKGNAGQGSFYRSQHELISIFVVGGEPHRNNVQLGRFGRNRSNLWQYAGVNSFGTGRDEALSMHPTVKPVAMIADAIRDCTSRGEIILDPFLGSGTTLIAAEKTGRRCCGIEYEPGYVDVAIRRWQAFTKSDARFEDDGRTFDEIAAERSSAKEIISENSRTQHSGGGS